MANKVSPLTPMAQLTILPQVVKPSGVFQPALTVTAMRLFLENHKKCPSQPSQLSSTAQHQVDATPRH